MPIYEYECGNCGKIAEKMQQPDIKAPICCGKVMNRRMSVCSFKIKQIGRVRAHHNGKEIYSA